MIRKKNHSNSHQPIAWLDVWKKIQGIVTRLGAPDEIQKAALSDDTLWHVEDDTMYIFIPDNLREYIEQNMDSFKPVLWPFLLSHHCTKLIYED